MKREDIPLKGIGMNYLRKLLNFLTKNRFVIQKGNIFLIISNINTSFDYGNNSN
jgi:hypothetical protein